MLRRKMFRDMKAGRAQFASIFLMAFLGVFVYAGINAEWYGMQAEIGRYYQATNFPDFWVMGANFSAADAEKAAAIPGVEAVERRLTLDATAKLDGGPTVRVSLLDENKLSTPWLVEGAPFETGKDGIWLDESFARAQGLKVGGMLTLSASGVSLAKPILGLVMHPEYVYEVKDDSSFTPDPKSFGFAFVPRKAVPMSALLPYDQLMVKLDGSVPAATVKAALESTLAGHSSALLARDTMVSPAQFANEISQNQAMGGVFPVIFFLIAALTMLTTMTRLTAAQRTQIGTLKALGFRRRAILNHYVSYGLWLGLIGGILGLVTGPLAIPPILYSMQKAIYHLPEWRAAWSFSDFACVAVAVACCGASSYFACRRELSENPAATLRPRSPKAARHTRFEKSRLWRSLGFSAQWNLRDALRSPVRSGVAVIGVMGSIALLLLGLGLNDSVTAVSGRLYGELYRFQSKIVLTDGVTKAQLSAIEKAYPGQPVEESAVEFQAGGVEKSGTLTIAAPGNLYRFEGGAGRVVQLPDSGAAISGKMARLLNLQVGGTVRFRIYGETQWREAAVAAVYRTPIGQGIALSEVAWRAMGETQKPTAILTASGASSAASLPGVAAVQGLDVLKASFNKILDSIQAVIAILILASVVLGAVVLYNLGSLSFTERTRELATLKVLGFPHRKIRALLRAQNVWLTALGIALGVPVGYAFIGFMLSTISDSSDFQVAVSTPTLAISILATFLLSALVNALRSRKVHTLDMIASLKSVE